MLYRYSDNSRRPCDPATSWQPSRTARQPDRREHTWRRGRRDHWHLRPGATGRFPWRYVPAYLIAQLVGALLGALATWATFGAPGRDDANLAATIPGPDIGSGQGLLIEALVTFILVFVVISVATDERVPNGLAPIAIGAALTVGVFIAGPVTGGAVNPARALGPAMIAGQFAAIWIYIVGPLLGGVAAALAYDRFLARTEAPA